MHACILSSHAFGQGVDMQISYKAGLLTASFGRFCARLTGNSLKEFNRGLTHTPQEPLAVDHHIVEDPIDNEIQQAMDVEYYDENNNRVYPKVVSQGEV